MNAPLQFLYLMAKSIIGFFNFLFLVTHVTTAITCVTRIFKGYPR